MSLNTATMNPYSQYQPYPAHRAPLNVHDPAALNSARPPPRTGIPQQHAHHFRTQSGPWDSPYPAHPPVPIDREQTTRGVHRSVDLTMARDERRNEHLPSAPPSRGGSRIDAHPMPQLGLTTERRPESSRSRPLPDPSFTSFAANPQNQRNQHVETMSIPRSMALFQAPPPTASLPFLPQSSARAPTSRPLPLAPNNKVVPADGSSSSTSSPSRAQGSPSGSLSVLDRVRALQSQEGSNTIKRRALPHSPTAPPDLSQIPSRILQRSTTLPKPAFPSINHRPPDFPAPTETSTLRQSHSYPYPEAAVVPHGELRPSSPRPPSIPLAGAKHEPKRVSSLDDSTTSEELQARSEAFTSLYSGNDTPQLEEIHPVAASHPCERASMADTAGKADTEDTPTPLVRVSLSLDESPSDLGALRTASEAPLVNPPPKDDIPVAPPVSTSDMREAGPRRMQVDRREPYAAKDKATPSTSSKPRLQESRQNGHVQAKQPQSLTFRFAAMALEEENRSSQANSTSTRLNSLDDSPPKPFRALSDSVDSQPLPRLPLRNGPPSIPRVSVSLSDPHPEESEDEERSPSDSGSSRAPIPKIVFGGADDSYSDASDSSDADAPTTPLITLSAATPTITVSSSNSPSLPSIIEVLDTSPTKPSKRIVPGRKVIRKGGLCCGGCGESIVGRIVSAMGVRWHPSCFRCSICGELLEHVSAYEHQGQPYCHLDYHEQFAPQCFHCKTPIVDEQFITLDDTSLGKRTYHEQHFFCAECGDPFLGPSGQPNDDDVGFTVYRGYAYCEACHVRLRMPKCTKCRKSIRDGMQAVEALGGKWHQECFVCAGCEKPFDDPAFFQRGTKPFCEQCFSIIVKSEMD